MLTKLRRYCSARLPTNLATSMPARCGVSAEPSRHRRSRLRVACRHRPRSGFPALRADARAAAYASLGVRVGATPMSCAGDASNAVDFSWSAAGARTRSTLRRWDGWPCSTSRREPSRPAAGATTIAQLFLTCELFKDELFTSADVLVNLVKPEDAHVVLTQARRCASGSISPWTRPREPSGVPRTRGQLSWRRSPGASRWRSGRWFLGR